MFNLETLSIICAGLQIIGLVLIILAKILPRFTGAIISVCGFASIVQVFLPLEGHQSPLFIVAAIAGIGIVIGGCIKADTD